MGQLVYTYFPTASIFFLVYIRVIMRLYSSLLIPVMGTEFPVIFANYKKKVRKEGRVTGPTKFTNTSKNLITDRVTYLL